MQKVFSNIKIGSTFWILSIVLLVGFILRVLNFPNIPNGLNQDEINAGYEAWSLLNFGKDHWGYEWPVYFLSWGSGQNVLYSYFLIPFMAVLGPSDLTIRIGMLIVGILLPLATFFLAKLWLNKNTALLSAATTAIFPELIRGSRWAVESNLVPFLSIVGLLVFSLSLLGHLNKNLIIFCLVPLALLPYAYLITVVPVIITITVMLFVKRENLKKAKKYWVASLILFTTILTPLGLFFVKLTILKGQPFSFEKYLPFSLPQLKESRYSQLIEDKNSYFDILFKNLKNLFSGIYDDQVGGGSNVAHVSLILILVVISLSFMKFTKQNFNFGIIQLWVLVSLPLILFVPLSNIRGNMLYVPSIILTSHLIVYLFTVTKKRWVKVSLICIGVLYVSYVFSWYVSYQTSKMDYFYKGAEKAVEFVDKNNTSEAPVLFLGKDENFIDLQYMQLMWFLKISPDEITNHEDPELNLRNYYFTYDSLENSKESSYYYDITNIDFRSGCKTPELREETLYEYNGWAVIKCSF